MSAPASRPIHPCVLSLTDGTRGAEFSTWAHLTQKSLCGSDSGLPNLVTASASTINIYSIDDKNSGKLRLEHTFGNLTGSVTFLATLTAERHHQGNVSTADCLLAGFAGHPRLSVLKLQTPESGSNGSNKNSTPKLQALSLLDFSSVLSDHSHGAVTTVEIDATFTSLSQRPGRATVGCVLGGGVAVAVVEVIYHSSIATVNTSTTTSTTVSANSDGWCATEPYILPLPLLAAKLPHHHRGSYHATGGGATSGMNTNASHGGGTSHSTNAAAAANALASLATGFGDILAATFLSGYLEPVLLLLHSEAGGPLWSGRLGRRSANSDSHGTNTTTVGGGANPPLYVTALSLAVAHTRTAVLWSHAVPSDSFMLSSSSSASYSSARNHHGSQGTGCMVVGVNSVVVMEAGRIVQVLAVNGWARATCSSNLQDRLTANPIIKLAVSLDGCGIAWLSEHSALVSLRTGQLYILQRAVDEEWMFMPTGQVLGAIGEVTELIALPFRDAGTVATNTAMGKLMGNKVANNMSLGLIFAGSRLGDSILLGYALETKMVSAALVKHEDFVKKEEDQELPVQGWFNETPSSGSERDLILQLEEDALYAVGDGADENETKPDVVPLSDEEKSADLQESKRPRVAKFTIVRALVPMDALVSLGPLGAPCEAATAKIGENTPLFSAPARIFPCGYGSSGGLALVNVPGRDDRHILMEEDCKDVECLFSLVNVGIVLMAMSAKEGGGFCALRLSHSEGADEFGLEEVSLPEWCSPTAHNGKVYASAEEVFSSTLLSAGEFSDGSFAVLISQGGDEPTYSLVTLKEDDAGSLHMLDAYDLACPKSATLLKASAFVFNDDPDGPLVSFGCLWSTGDASVVTAGPLARFMRMEVAGANSSSIDMDIDIDDEVNFFYSSQLISTIDVFRAPKALSDSKVRGNNNESVLMEEDESSPTYTNIIDDEDDDLYGKGDFVDPLNATVQRQSVAAQDHASLSDQATYFAVCRQSGQMDIFPLAVHTGTPSACWSCTGCGLGQGVLQTDSEHNKPTLPRTHMVSVTEARFFFTGPTADSTNESAAPYINFCFLLETTKGDMSLYKLSLDSLAFQRMVSSAKDNNAPEKFRYNKFHSFSGISGQDGLFVAGPRPMWLVSERGHVKPIFHRSRHAAPAGGAHQPITGFCYGFPTPGIKDPRRTGFLVLHERVGRVGNQRLTAFNEISSIFQSNGLLPGSGLCVEKIRFGVTVRQIKFLNHPDISSGDHPLYAMLVSKEEYANQSSLNSDGLTPEERAAVAHEKETAKLERQVEADLGGFDVESEWVEEIERENCFSISQELGGAPPVWVPKYAIWIVDASNNWVVVDSYELEDSEHGMSLQPMNLSEFRVEVSTADVEDDLPLKYFVAVGTGVLDQNGEDVGSRGRALLLELNISNGPSLVPGSPNAELKLVYEKEIFHGPVTSMSCLSAEGKNRLVIGAGADINIEQWGSNKLTQVGFFRATMQILEIMLFKNFLLLSDAYDSLYFLVWRESDKSLTLLSKDYDPIPVYAAGIMSRGAAMTFLCHDDRQNLQFFQYAPGEAAARGGNKLVCRADYHLGTQTSAFASHFCRSSLVVHSATPSSTIAALKQQDPLVGRSDDDQRLGVHFGTTDGGIGAVVPLSEPVYWRLVALQSVLSNALESDCALSERAWRLYRRTPRRGGCRNNDRKKGVIDGDLLLQFADLSLPEQEDLASAIGSTVAFILDNILELHCSGMIL